jgi:hypothetical protein
MENYRVTIKHSTGNQTNLISTVVPANNEKQAIEKVISANGIVEVLSKKAELLKSN